MGLAEAEIREGRQPPSTGRKKKQSSSPRGSLSILYSVIRSIQRGGEGSFYREIRESQGEEVF